MVVSGLTVAAPFDQNKMSNVFFSAASNLNVQLPAVHVALPLLLPLGVHIIR